MRYKNGSYRVKQTRLDDKWSVKKEGNVTTYFSSQYSGKKSANWAFEDNLYEFKKLTVTEVDGEKTYDLREGSGAHHMCWNGLKAAVSSVGGAVGPAFQNLPSVKIKFG